MAGTAEHHLGRAAEAAARRFGDYDSLWFEGRWHRSGELADRARRAAAGLAAVDVRPGDRVVVCMANCPEVSIAYTALWQAGAVVTPVIFLLTVPELHHVLADSGAMAAVTTPEFLPKVQQAAAGTAVRAVVLVGDGPGEGPGDSGPLPVLAFAELESAAPVPLVDRDDNDLAALMYTGGTTGRSKGVMLSHANLWASGAGAYHGSYQAGLTRSLVSLPLSHAYGMLITVGGFHTREPTSTVLMRWFDPAAWLRLVVEHRVQRTNVVPSMLQILLQQPLEDYDLSELALVGSGAAPLARDVLEAFEKRVPGVVVGEGYGCTESAGLLSTSPPGQRRAGSVGRPAPGYEIRVVGPDDEPVPVGELGEIVARGGGIMQGYWQAPTETAQALRGGWLHTGDLGRLDEDGYLYVVDRTKDLVIRNGYNVYPRDVEDVLLGHPAVAAAAVVGRPDPLVGEEVVAFVALVPGSPAVTGAELVGHARRHLAPTKYPREVRVLDAIPLTSVGKTDRKALRALVRG